MPRRRCTTSSKLARRGVSLAMMLRDAGGGGGYGAGHDPCGFKGVRPRERDGELERAAGGAGARPRVSTSAADLFVAGTSVASKARAAGSLLRNLRLPGGGQEDGESRSWESELYQVWDVTSSTVHTEQTKLATSGDLVFVRQGRHGALSLVIVGGRAPGGPPEDEFSILIRGC